MKNKCAKTRDVNDPYEIWKSGDWEWRVLKKYQRPDKAADNPHARWFVAAKSPYTHGSWEYGDTYVSDIVRQVMDRGGVHVSLHGDIWVHSYTGHEVLNQGAGTK